MPAAKKPNRTASAAVAASPSLPTLLRALVAEKKLRPRSAAVEGLAAVQAVVAKDCAPDAMAFFGFLATHRFASLGLWRIAKPKDMLAKPRAGAPFDATASVAAATGTIYLGKDGSGSQFFLLRARALSEVFIHDPGAGQLALLATSLAAFVELNLLIDRWDQFCEGQDVDPDPDAMDEIDSTLPGFAALRGQAKALRGRLDLGSGSDYDETVEALAKAKLRAKSASEVVAKYKAAKRRGLAKP